MTDIQVEPTLLVGIPEDMWVTTWNLKYKSGNHIIIEIPEKRKTLCCKKPLKYTTARMYNSN